jgi:O-antigen ligase
LVGLGSRPLLAALTIAVVALSVLLGGGTQQGLWSDGFVVLVSLVLLGYLGPSILDRLLSAPRPLIVGLAAAVLLPAYELLPLPPAVWTVLPGRAPFVAAFSGSGMELPWLPVSLDPAASWRSLLSLLPAIAIFLATGQLGQRARRTISVVLIALSLVSVLLGLAQVMQGPTSALRPFAYTHPMNSVGFFANRNHFAALLYSMIPLVAAWIVATLSLRGSQRLIALVCFVLAYVALLLGLGMASSRAGLALASLAALASLPLVFMQGAMTARRALAILAAPIVLGIVVVSEFALFNVLGRFDADAFSDYRFHIAEKSAEAAMVFQPFGSGLGTFVPIYQTFETGADVIAMYINHAHNDWLELWLEGGWPVLLLIAALLAWLARAGVRAWRAKGSGDLPAIDRTLPRAATIVVVLLLAHSAVDYPLRTTAMMAVFAFCAALLTPAPTRKPAIN